MKFVKIFIFLIFSSLITFASFANDKIGMTHEFGSHFTALYDYNEPEFMHNKSDHFYWLNNLGLFYNFKKSFLVSDYLTEFELDSDVRRIEFDYASAQGATIKKVKNETYNLRALYGLQLTDDLMLKTGIGYRYLKDPGGGTHTSAGGFRYDRLQEYRYVPFLAELKMPIQEINGKLKFEFDYIFYGYHQALFGVGGGANRDAHMRNDDGYMVKTSYKMPFEGFGFVLEPYYEFQSVEESNVARGFLEPSNITDEFGMKFSKIFGENKLKTIPKAKRVQSMSDDYYFGLGLIETEVESGLSQLTGTAKLDEKDIGEQVFAGMNFNEYLDLEFAFTKFGESVLTCGINDQFVTDGRFQNGRHPNGTLLNCITTQNKVSINIHTNSVSAALKPNYDIQINDNFSVNVFGSVGLNRWDQSETTLVLTGAGGAGSTTVFNYGGYDPFYGAGATVSYKDLNFSIKYDEYDMYYDAEAVRASLSYNF